MEFKERIAAELEAPDHEPAPLTDATPAELAEAAALFLDNKRGRQIKIIPMAGKTDICDFMVLATGTSNTHDNNTWTVLDFSHVLVHVFTRETRDFYNLDKLYGDN